MDELREYRRFFLSFFFPVDMFVTVPSSSRWRLIQGIDVTPGALSKGLTLRQAVFTSFAGSSDPFGRSRNAIINTTPCLVSYRAHVCAYLCGCKFSPCDGGLIFLVFLFFRFVLFAFFSCCSSGRTELMSILGDHKLPEDVITSLLKWKTS